MPKGHPGEGWGCRHDLTRRRQIFEKLEHVPDISRGESRFAAEVALAELHAVDVPMFAHERAVATLQILARS